MWASHASAARGSARLDPMLAAWLGDAAVEQQPQPQPQPRPQLPQPWSVGAPDSDDEDTSGEAKAPPAETKHVEPQALLLNRLGDERSDVTRRKAAQALLEAADGVDARATQEWFGALLKPALRRLNDRSETVRELAAQLVERAVRALWPLEPQLAFILPVVVSRLETAPPAETCEEVREVLVRVLACCVRNVAKEAGEDAAEALSPHLPLLHRALQRCVADRHPETRVASLECSSALARACPLSVRGVAPHLLAAAAPSVIHRLATVRLAGLDAADALVRHGGAEVIREMAAFRESNVIDVRAFFQGETRFNLLALLVQDENARVRHRFFTVLAGWLTELRERGDYETLLMPYLLSGLADASAEVRELARDTLEALGVEHEREHAEELADVLRFAPPPHPADTLPLPTPFAQRPRFGARLVVGRFVPRLMHAVLTELADWRAETKTRAATLLRSLLVYAEEGATQWLPQLVPTLCRAWNDAEVRGVVVECATLLGRRCPLAPILAVAEVHLSALADEEPLWAAACETLHTLLAAAPREQLASHAAALRALADGAVASRFVSPRADRAKQRLLALAQESAHD